MEPATVPTNGNGLENIAEQAPIISSEIDLEFLPAVYDVIKSIEKDPSQEPPGSKGRDSQDTSSKVLQLEKKLADARSQILQLAGIEHSKEEQLQQLELYRQQVVLKQQLISKYRNLCTFSLSD